MSLSNTSDRYGLVARGLHWSTAALILVLLPLGLLAEQWPYETSEQLARKAWLFSLHKTLGIAVFLVALARILWAAIQPRPRLLNADRRFESRLAETIHWLLYASLVATPLTGWVHHAATTGFAPIWWPLGQSLPFVPKSETVAVALSGMHFISVIVLVAALALHVAGALKHHVIDRDATLRRMLFGTPASGATDTGHSARLPRAVALASLLVALGAGGVTGLYAPAPEGEAAPQLTQVETGWQVQEGTLGITVRQMGSDVSGSFADWTAGIDFSETAVDGRHGHARVTIAIGSLTLGSVTAQALGPDYFAAGDFPTATFDADLLASTDGEHVAEGTLTLRGIQVPVSMPYTLTIENDRAEVQASLTLDRRDFRIGDSQPDEATLGHAVRVDIALTAIRAD